jgi:hypothetical protein
MNRTSQLRHPRVGGGGQYTTYSSTKQSNMRREHSTIGKQNVPALKFAREPRGKVK